MTLSMHSGEITFVDFSPPHGQHVITASEGGTAIVWLATDPQPEHQPTASGDVASR